MTEELIEVSELVSMAEVAEIIGVGRASVHAYRHRGILPEPVIVLGSGPIWRRSDIIDWQVSRPGKGWRRAA